MPEEEKKKITREKHPGLVAQGHKLAAHMKKRKKDKLRNKKHSTEQFSVQSTEQPSLQSIVQSNYVYGVGILDVPAIDVCVFFTYNTFYRSHRSRHDCRNIFWSKGGTR